MGRDVHTNLEECQKKNLKILSLLMNICLKHKANHLYDHYCTTSLAGAQITILVLFRNLITTWMLVKANSSVYYSVYFDVLVSAGIELIFFLEAGTGLCCGFRMRIKLIRH